MFSMCQMGMMGSGNAYLSQEAGLRPVGGGHALACHLSARQLHERAASGSTSQSEPVASE